MKKFETKTTIVSFVMALLLLTISVTTVITVTKNIATKHLREDGKLVTITSFTEEEPHREVLAMWDYTSNGKNYTNTEYIEYSGTYVVEVETYNGEELGVYEIIPRYYGEDKIYEGAEIERYKLRPIKTSIETIERISSEKEERLVSIEPLEKEERTQTLVPIKDIKE
jgi:hypothetical protein